MELADGRTLPQRVSVLGFSDQLMAEWLDLSTVAQSPSDMGRAAAELALCRRPAGRRRSPPESSGDFLSSSCRRQGATGTCTDDE
ncbi:substrate-binding domain-containing protein [Streptomyces europaeiscabiei]|uniref:substrate-binding domain-containing protein n=1 Tax=Streptomyces europaeiscabiei TaxID=146819 RepID=UPI0029B561DC|nr:substrate-binding domain-containing protein [Streptomyces europaeiscabiei]MDX3697962.1 substrate-binding domain-containing protein [Streptomyces europaeiscabiei]